jgi:hypothetical protein
MEKQKLKKLSVLNTKILLINNILNQGNLGPFKKYYEKDLETAIKLKTNEKRV